VALAPVPIGGAANIRRFLQFLGPDALDARLAGLCDAAEEPLFRAAMTEAGLGPCDDRAAMRRQGFFVCDTDLEDELIRALGPPAVMALAEARGDLRSFRKMQKQPEWRDRPVADQLRRWLAVSARRKIVYAPLLVDALPLADIPAPLSGVVDRALGQSPP